MKLEPPTDRPLTPDEWAAMRNERNRRDIALVEERFALDPETRAALLERLDASGLNEGSIYDSMVYMATRDAAECCAEAAKTLCLAVALLKSEEPYDAGQLAAALETVAEGLEQCR